MGQLGCYMNSSVSLKLLFSPTASSLHNLYPSPRQLSTIFGLIRLCYIMFASYISWNCWNTEITLVCCVCVCVLCTSKLNADIFVYKFDVVVLLQEVNFDSARGGVSVITEKGDVTTSYLYIQRARPADTGEYKCSPATAKNVTVKVHILKGITTDHHYH